MISLQHRRHWHTEMYNGKERIAVMYDKAPLIEPGRWYHLAIQWNMNDEGKIMRRLYLDGYVCAHTGAAGFHDGRAYWPNSIKPGKVLVFDGRHQIQRTGLMARMEE